MGKNLNLILVIFMISSLTTSFLPAFAGPVIIGGDDLTDHGFNTGSMTGAAGDLRLDAGVAEELGGAVCGAAAGRFAARSIRRARDPVGDRA